MKAYLEIEKIGDNVSGEMKLWRTIIDEMVPGLGTVTIGPDPFSKWVARITGFDPVYKYKREFMRYKKDYARSNSKGSRGVYQCYLLDSGYVYEVKGRKGRRWFCAVTEDGDIIEVDKEYVNQWIKDHSVSTS